MIANRREKKPNQTKPTKEKIHSLNNLIITVVSFLHWDSLKLQGEYVNATKNF